MNKHTNYSSIGMTDREKKVFKKKYRTDYVEAIAYVFVICLAIWAIDWLVGQVLETLSTGYLS